MADADFPSLARRDAELIGESPAPNGPDADAPVALDPVLASRLSEIEASARAGHAAFQAALEPARAATGAARGAEPGGEAWAQAVNAVSALEVSRRDVAVLMGDLDALYVARLAEEAAGTAMPGGSGQIDAARARITGWANAEEAEIARLRAMIGGS